MAVPTTNDSERQVRQLGLGYVVQSLSLDEVSAASGPSLLACASFVPEAGNFVELLSLDLLQPQPLRATGVRLPHYYPASKVRWLQEKTSERILATCSDHVRIWSADGQLRRLLSQEGNPQGPCAPVTGVDFGSSGSRAAPLLASCDCHGLCSIYDVETGSRLEALGLEQALSDVSCGPDGHFLVAGNRGDCFLIDTRCPKEVALFSSPTQVHGPARIASGTSRTDLFAVAWQGGGGSGSVCLYGGSKGSAREEASRLSHILPTDSTTATADLQWSPAYPEFLGCADEFGSVNLWHFPEAGIEAAKRYPGSSFFQWEPYSQHACTALALTPKVAGGNDHAVIVATMPSQGPSSGSLWVTPLPAPTKAKAARAAGAAASLAVPAGLRRGPSVGAGVGDLESSPLRASELPATTNVGGFESPSPDAPPPPLPPPALAPGATPSSQAASPEVRASTFAPLRESPTRAVSGGGAGHRSEGLDGFEGLRGLAASFGGLSSAPLSATMPTAASASPTGRGTRPRNTPPPVFPVDIAGDEARPGTSSFWAED